MATILLVDDEPLVRNFCSRVLLGIDGLELLQADGCSQAIQVARSFPGPIHLLLSDVLMPGAMDGPQLAETILAFRPDLKVVLMSGLTREPSAHRPEWRFMPKPFLPGALLSTLEEALGRPLSEQCPVGGLPC